MKPVIGIRQRSKYMAPWVTKEMLELGRKRNVMRAKAHRTSKDEDWLVARQLRNQANNLAKLLKRNYYEGEISNSRCNPRKLWSLAKEASSKKNNITLPSYSNKLSLANNFNNFFVNIGADLAEAFQDIPPLGKNFPPTGTGDNAENF